MLQAEKRTLQIDVHHLVPNLFGQFSERAIGNAHSVGAYPSVVEGAVDPSPLGHDRSNHSLHVGLFGDIALEEGSFAPLLLDHADGLLRTLDVVAGDHGHLSAQTGELQCRGAAHTCGASSYQGYLPFDIDWHREQLLFILLCSQYNTASISWQIPA